MEEMGSKHEGIRLKSAGFINCDKHGNVYDYITFFNKKYLCLNCWVDSLEKSGATITDKLFYD